MNNTQSSRLTLQHWFVLIVLTPMIILLIIYLARVQNDDKARQREAEFLAKFGEVIPAMCQQMDEKRPSAVDFSVTYPTMRVLLLDDNGQYHALQDEMIDPFLAEDRDDLNLLACINGSTELIEKCEYYDDHPGIVKLTISRFQQNIRVILLDPLTDSYVTEFSVEGDEPEQCPDRVRSDATHIFGPNITFLEFIGALTRAVENANN